MSTKPNWDLDNHARYRNLSRAVPHYEKAAVLQEEVSQRLLDRLDYVRIQPRRVLDLGARLGRSSRALKQRFPEALVVSADVPDMLAASGPCEGVHPVAALLPELPFRDAAFDLVFSSLELPWCSGVTAALEALCGLLAPGGLLMFTTLGPDTLVELRLSWQHGDERQHVHGFFDMHDIGDAMLRAGFAEPVMDTERIRLTYADSEALLEDLRHAGAQNVLHERRRTLTGPGRLRAMREAYESLRSPEGRLPATCEVIYGHAWGPAPGTPRRGEQGEIATVPVDRITRRKRDLS